MKTRAPQQWSRTSVSRQHNDDYYDGHGGRRRGEESGAADGGCFPSVDERDRGSEGPPAARHEKREINTK